MVVAGGGSIIDAADELYRWIELRRIPDAAPLFCHASGGMITVDEVRDVVKSAMAAVGLDPRRSWANIHLVFSTRSLRGDTTARGDTCPTHPVKIHGGVHAVFGIFRKCSASQLQRPRNCSASQLQPPEKKADHDNVLEHPE